MADEYYLQDKRQHVGNSMSWWRKNGAGYCCDVREAHVFTKEEAFAQHRMRSTDVPWPKAYIDAHIAHHVDMQRVDLEQARRMYSPEETSPAPGAHLREIAERLDQAKARTCAHGVPPHVLCPKCDD